MKEPEMTVSLFIMFRPHNKDGAKLKTSMHNVLFPPSFSCMFIIDLETLMIHFLAAFMRFIVIMAAILFVCSNCSMLTEVQ